MSQNIITTRNGNNISSSYSPSTSELTKIKSNTKKTQTHNKETTHSTYPSKLDYHFLEDLKWTKSNISLFELMKLLHIQDIFIKTLQGIAPNNTKETNVEGCKGRVKLSNILKINTQRSNMILMHPSLEKYRILTLDPFL